MRWLLAASVLLASAAHAHEFWLLPSSFSPAVGQRVGLQLRVGEGWPGEALPRDPARVVRFAWIDGAGERRVAGAAGAEPAGVARANLVGPAIAIYRSSDSLVTLDAELFERYLRLEGLEAVSEHRRARGESAAPGRELFSRSAKALVQVGGKEAPTAGFDRIAGLTLELVPLDAPQTLVAGAPLRLQLLQLGQPLSGTLVKAFERDGGGRVEARTGVDGVATLALPRLGDWMFSAVAMAEAPAGSGADWKSIWAALTLRTGQAR
ncbi:MAG: DUF4198 domain-containing protein [Caldimonas sp.]